MTTNAQPPSPSQADLILDELKRRLGHWVPMPELYAVSGAYAVHSRISDLRARGWRIETKVERHAGSRVQMSSYRLVSPLQLQIAL